MKSNKNKYLLFLSILLVSLIFVSCVKTEYIGSNNIIEPNEVKNEIGKDDVIIVDARSKEDYEKGHIKDSINLNPLELSTKDPLPGMLLPKKEIERVLSRKGISNDSIIYVYDNNDGVNASRLWWTLKAYGHDQIKVINKGEKGLVEAELDLSKEVPKLERTSYVAKDLNENMLVDLDTMKNITQDDTSDVFIIDTRSKAEYDEGAIPGATLYPHTKNLYSDGSFKSAKNIYLSYNELGINRETPIVLYCKTSFRAAQTALLLEEAGFTNVKVYDGAWVEWSMDMPVEKQEEPIVMTPQDGS